MRNDLKVNFGRIDEAICKIERMKLNVDVRVRWIMFLLALSPLFSYAQQPFGKDAVWYYEFDQFGYKGYISLTYTGDTLMKGIMWQKFKKGGITELRTGPDPINDLLQWPITGYFFMHSRNDSVFRMLPDTTALLLYDFSAGIGDSWQYDNLDTSRGHKDLPIATVVDIGYDTIQGFPAKYWEVVPPLDSVVNVMGDTIYACSSSSCLQGKIYKDFASTRFSTALFEPIGNYYWPLKTATTYAYYQMRCFSSPKMNLKFYSGKCDYWSRIGLNEYANNQQKNYPNPARDHINIVFTHPTLQNTTATATFYNIMGQEVFSKEIEFQSGGATLLLGEVGINQSGTYILQLKIETQVFVEKILVQ